MADKKKNRVKQEQPEEVEEIMESEIVADEPVDEQPTSEQASTVSAEEFEQMTQELEKAQAQSRDYFEGWQRERADFANYKRRIERDQQMVANNIKIDIVKKYLPVLDDMERALKTRPTEGTAGSWAEGIELIYRKLKNILEAEGVKRIPAETQEFDPNFHEAISYEENPDHGSGEIIEVVQQGYTLGDRVIRPAMVRVAR